MIRLRDALEGTWDFHRVIRDFRNPVSHGNAVGRAQWISKSPLRLLYHEEALLTYGRYRGMVSQSYFFDFDDHGQAQVRFADGRPFYALPDTACAMEHICGADVYRGLFRLINSFSLSMSWNIRGPRKSQDIITIFRKA